MFMSPAVIREIQERSSQTAETVADVPSPPLSRQELNEVLRELANAPHIHQARDQRKSQRHRAQRRRSYANLSEPIDHPDGTTIHSRDGAFRQAVMEAERSMLSGSAPDSDRFVETAAIALAASSGAAEQDILDRIWKEARVRAELVY